MKIFCDFDGTSAKNDVGNLLFRTFADRRVFEIVKVWKEGKISSRECLIQECAITRVTKPELEKFVDEQELDPFFEKFVKYSQRKMIEIEIVSVGDGLSDRCGAQEADIVFAKNGRDLLNFCQMENINHYEFNDFQDVLTKLENIIK